MLLAPTLLGHQFPLSIIGYVVWLYHCYALSCRDVEELLFGHGIEVSRESMRTWCMKFSGELTQNLRDREPRRGSRKHLDEMHVVVGRLAHWLWRAIVQHRSVLDLSL